MIPYQKIESLAACRMTPQQIADVLDIDLDELKQDREGLGKFYKYIRKGRAKGEAELRAALFKLARKGDAFALRELLKVDKNQD
ncbi:hypothetical protein [Citrobacter braakii]|uniref:hypothetical protein n=1 Tax=Citrobacter braakii TaxID=57706 RepID=UPI000AF5154C|nr:hypothetical protein [Citrobacter braakii]